MSVINRMATRGLSLILLPLAIVLSLSPPFSPEMYNCSSKNEAAQI